MRGLGGVGWSLPCEPVRGVSLCARSPSTKSLWEAPLAHDRTAVEGGRAAGAQASLYSMHVQVPAWCISVEDACTTCRPCCMRTFMLSAPIALLRLLGVGARIVPHLIFDSVFEDLFEGGGHGERECLMVSAR